ncbi:MAG: biopolymer transporter ExbD [Treponema sp.]|jgi:biopolymer transport protein ExbD|nr:biopolymer transporter ExbD [Treponema sp.]
MKLRRNKRTGIQESSAASDLAFLLIIYFIVIAGFNINKGFLVNLPAKDSKRMILREDLLRFTLDGEGYLLFGDELIGVSEAGNLIRSARAANPNIAVILTIDPGAKWQRVVSFVELAQQQRIEAFSFTIKKESQ